MSNTPITCPHCGKEIVSEEKLAFHLTKQCPKLSQLTGTKPLASTAAKG